MIYNGKEVLTPETFRYSQAQVGDYVTQEVVDDAMDCLPPACMTSNCAQMGEPYSHRGRPADRQVEAHLCHVQACHGRDRRNLAVLRSLFPGRGHRARVAVGSPIPT